MTLIRQQILLEPELKQIVLERAHEEGISLSDAIRKSLIKTYVEKYNRVHEDRLEALRMMKRLTEKFKNVPTFDVKKAIEFGRK